MSAQPLYRQLFTMPSQHIEHITRAISAFTIDPMKSGLSYFFPIIGAWCSGYRSVSSNSSQEAMMPRERAITILGAIENMTTKAQIGVKTATYIALNHHFFSYGGSYSLTTPTLCLPYHHLFRQNAPAFGVGYVGTPDTFSDDEVRFFIARELAQIGENNSLFRIAAKVASVAVLVFVYTASLGWIGAPIMGAAVLAYILSERIMSGRSDINALKILQKCNVPNPKEVATSALKKIREQNLRTPNWYITVSGDNRLDLLNPALSDRINALQNA